MKYTVLLRGLGCGVLASLLSMAGARAADTYPSHSIRMYVGFSAGGATDIIARLVGQQLSERLGQAIVVENRAGAGGTIATALASKAPADGYTLLFTSASHAINATLYKSLPYDPIKDFEPIVPVASTLNVLVVNPAMPVHTVQEYITYAKAHPGKVTMASAGVGSSANLAGVQFTSMAGISVNPVPYKGTADALRDVAAGEVNSTVDSVSAYLPYIKNGSLRALGVGDLKRSLLLPDVPTIDESGLHGYEVNAWVGLLAPANTPRPVVDRLNREVNDILKSPNVLKTLRNMGARPLGDTPAGFAGLIKHDVDQFARLIKTAGIQPQ